MIKPIILAKGYFKPKDLLITVSKSDRKIDLNVENQLNNLWERKKRGAKENGQLLYNGLSYRLNHIKSKEGTLFVNFGTVDFKTRECLVEAEGYYNLTEEYWRKGCHTLATVKTLDDKYLIAELSGKSMNKNKTDFFGGIMEIKPKIKSGKDVFNSLYKELEEEAFIIENDIAWCILNMIYITPSTDVGFYFETMLKITSNELEHRFKNKPKDIDIKSVKIMSRADLIKELKNHNSNKQFLATKIEI